MPQRGRGDAGDRSGGADRDRATVASACPTLVVRAYGINAGERSTFALPNEVASRRARRRRRALNPGLRASVPELGDEASARLAQVAGHDLVPGRQAQVGADDPGDTLGGPDETSLQLGSDPRAEVVGCGDERGSHNGK